MTIVFIQKISDNFIMILIISTNKDYYYYRCCRHHDLGCPLSIEPGATEYGLTNERIHTVMHCSCDERFRSCLKMARTQAADIVGNLFFNIIDIPCFVFSKQRVRSNQNKGTLFKKLMGGF